MGKKNKKYKEPASKEHSSIFPSRFGSHKSMVDKEASELINAGLVVCKDGRGRYITKEFRLDSGIADPARFADTPYRDKRLDFYLSLASQYLKE